MLTVAYLNTVWNVDEFSAMDYSPNIVSKCHFSSYFEHLWPPKRSWKIFLGVLEGCFLSEKSGNPSYWSSAACSKCVT